MTPSRVQCKASRFLLRLLLLFGVLGTAQRTHALGAIQASADQALDVSETILVQFQADLSAQERAGLIEQLGGELLTWLPALQTAQIRLHQPETVAAAAAQAYASGAIRLIEPDGPVQAATLPNDPGITDQRKVYAAELLDLFAGWEYTSGDRNVIIAVLDSGVDATHPEFSDQLLPGYDFVQRDDDPQDENGHGTHVAGIIGARANNKLGVAGVCTHCSLLPVRVLNAQNIGSWMNVAQGVTFAVDHGARVIVMSLGSTVYSQTMRNAVDYAHEHGVLLVAAAGNANSADPFYPAAFEEVMGVGATTAQDQKWPFSNYGQNIDVVAPGDAIYSTYPSHNNSDYQILTGTSMAAPFVAGLAGLLFAQTPTRSITDVSQLIITSAVDLGEPGRDSRFGSGRIDIHAALAAGAAVKLPSTRLIGTIWQDHDLDNNFDPDHEQALAGVLVQVQNEQGEQMALAVSNSTGTWRVTGLPTGTYTLHITSTISSNVLPPLDRQVVLTEPLTLQGLNFGFIPTPTSSAVADFTVTRSGQSVTLTWTVSHPLVESVQVERALAEDGPYTAILTRTVTAAEIAARQPITLSEQLPAELGQVNVYYRLVLLPAPVLVGPKEAWPVHSTNARTLFIPLIQNFPADEP